jgi:hypothetical protein
MYAQAWLTAIAARQWLHRSSPGNAQQTSTQYVYRHNTNAAFLQAGGTQNSHQRFVHYSRRRRQPIPHYSRINNQ